MTIQEIAQKMANSISRKKDADDGAAPLVALLVHVALQGDRFGQLQRLYTLTFEAAASTKKKTIQSHFSRAKKLMAALIDFQDHPEMIELIESEMALVDFQGDTACKAEGAKRFPKKPSFTRMATAIRMAQAEDVPFVGTHEHVDLSECRTFGEVFPALEAEITRLSEIKGTLESLRDELLDEAVGPMTDFEIGGDTDVAPTFSIKS